MSETKLRKVDIDVSSACAGGVPTLTCKSCGYTGEPRLSWHPCVDGSTHLRAECPGCDEWIAWVTQAVL